LAYLTLTQIAALVVVIVYGKGYLRPFGIGAMVFLGLTVLLSFQQRGLPVIEGGGVSGELFLFLFEVSLVLVGGLVGIVTRWLIEPRPIDHGEDLPAVPLAPEPKHYPTWLVKEDGSDDEPSQ
jgi:CBS domain-containing protein